MSPLEAVAERLKGFATLQKSSISNVEIEDRRGFEDLRRLLKIVSATDMHLDLASLTCVWTTLFQLLDIPEAAGSIASLALPHAASPVIQATARRHEVIVVSDLGKCSVIQGQVPPLAQHASCLAMNHPCRSHTAHATAVGSDNEHGHKALYAIDAAGTRIQDHAVMMSWLHQAEIVLKFLSGTAHVLNTAEPSRHVLDPTFQQTALLALLPFLTYAPWTTPELKEWAESFLSALGDCTSPGRAGQVQGVGHADRRVPIRTLVSKHADALLEWCRLRSLHGAWKEPQNASVRWLILSVITSIRFPSFTPDIAARSLPLAYRLMDDWEVTNVWIGTSCMVHILENAVSAEIRTAAGGPLQPELLNDALARARTCRHPTMAHVLTYATAAYMYVMHGMTEERLRCNTPALKKALHTGGSITSSGGGSIGLWDTPVDIALLETVRSIGLAGGAAVQYGILTWLPALIIMHGEQSCRHYAELLPPLCAAAGSTDVRLACAGLHALTVCIQTSTAYWTGVHSSAEGGSERTQVEGLHAGIEGGQQQAVEDILTACMLAGLNAAGGYAVLPAMDNDGQLTASAGILHTGAARQAGDLLAHYARLCFIAVRAVCPHEVAAFQRDTLSPGQGEEGAVVELVERAVGLLQAAEV